MELGVLSASELAGLADVTQAEVDRLVSLGILVAWDGAGPFLNGAPSASPPGAL